MIKRFVCITAIITFVLLSPLSPSFAFTDNDIYTRMIPADVENGAVWPNWGRFIKINDLRYIPRDPDFDNQPSYEFNGVNSYIEIDKADENAFDYSVFIVAKLDGTPRRAYNFWSNRLRDSNNCQTILQYSNRRIFRFNVDGGGADSPSNPCPFSPPNESNAAPIGSRGAHLFTIVWNAETEDGSSITPGSIRRWIDGREYATPFDGLGSNPEGPDGTKQTTLGGYIGADLVSGSPLGLLKGKVADLIIFKKALTESERRDVESYLSRRYRIG